MPNSLGFQSRWYNLAPFVLTPPISASMGVPALHGWFRQRPITATRLNALKLCATYRAWSSRYHSEAPAACPPAHTILGHPDFCKRSLSASIQPEDTNHFRQNAYGTLLCIHACSPVGALGLPLRPPLIFKQPCPPGSETMAIPCRLAFCLFL